MATLVAIQVKGEMEARTEMESMAVQMAVQLAAQTVEQREATMALVVTWVETLVAIQVTDEMEAKTAMALLAGTQVGWAARWGAIRVMGKMEAYMAMALMVETLAELLAAMSVVTWAAAPQVVRVAVTEMGVGERVVESKEALKVDREAEKEAGEMAGA